MRCAADDVIEVAGPAGELIHVREFSGADEAHDWPDFHDPVNPDIAFGYHAPDVFHLEVRSPLQLAVASGVAIVDGSTVAADVELRQPDHPVSGFNYGLVVNANGDGSLFFTVQDMLAADGKKTPSWCVRHGSDPLVAVGVTAGVAVMAPEACEVEGLLEVGDVRNRLAVGFGNAQAQFWIGDVTVATIAEVFKPDGTFGFTVQNSAPSLLSHAHFDNLAVASF